MRLVWIETEELEREKSIAKIGQVMIEKDDGTARYVSAIRSDDESDDWQYAVTNSSMVPKKSEDWDDDEESCELPVEYELQFDKFEDARASEYGVYFLFARLVVMAETEGLDENNLAVIDMICDLFNNEKSETMISLLKSVEKNSYVAVMKAAVVLNNVTYVSRYIREFNRDDKGPGRILDFNPSQAIVDIVKAHGGVEEVLDWDMKAVRDKLREFNKARDWDKFHTPENLAKSIAIESGELLECFQWSDKYDRDEVTDELCDVMLYGIMMADRLNLDIKQAMMRKIAENGAKYPVKKVKGKSTKYNKL